MTRKIRFAALSLLVVAAACSSPTVPRLPPAPPEEPEAPDRPGYHAEVTSMLMVAGLQLA